MCLQTLITNSFKPGESWAFNVVFLDNNPPLWKSGAAIIIPTVDL